MAEPRERPIIFSGPMIRAILEGRKSVTRRLLNPQPELGKLGPAGGPYTEEHWLYDHSRYPSAWLPGGPLHLTHTPWSAGDRLYVKEAWRLEFEVASEAYFVRYLADNGLHPLPDLKGKDGDVFCGLCEKEHWKLAERGHSHVGKNRLGRFMFKWAARIWLEVLSVRAERLREITEEEAKAEGVTPRGCTHPGCSPGSCAGSLYRPEFIVLFTKLNKLPLDANPWLRRIEFKRIEAPHG